MFVFCVFVRSEHAHYSPFQHSSAGPLATAHTVATHVSSMAATAPTPTVLPHQKQPAPARNKARSESKCLDA
jgi:hypothetical protein